MDRIKHWTCNDITFLYNTQLYACGAEQEDANLEQIQY